MTVPENGESPTKNDGQTGDTGPDPRHDAPDGGRDLRHDPPVGGRDVRRDVPDGGHDLRHDAPDGGRDVRRDAPDGGPYDGRENVRENLTRWAAAAAFLLVGLVFSSYLVRVPTLKLAHDLSAGGLGLLLVLPTVSAVVVMQRTGALVARFGSATVVRISGAGLPIALIGLAIAGDPIQLAVALLIFGAVDGLIDVSMNAQAIAVERRLNRPIMNGCHAAWSIGAMAGSGLGGLAIGAGLSLTAHYVLIAVAGVLLALASGRYLLPAAADRVGGDEPAKVRVGWRSGWTPRVLMFGLMGGIVLLCEGAVGNWSGVFLHEDRGAALSAAALGYIAFTVCQTAGRLIGDRLQQRLGAPRLVRWSGAIGVAGLAVAVLVPVPAVSIVGFALLGVGLSALLPIIFSAVGHGGAQSDSATAAAALSRFTTLTYTGLLLGPVLIGWSAEVIGLTATLLVLLVLLLGVTLNAGITADADRRSEKDAITERTVAPGDPA